MQEDLLKIAKTGAIVLLSAAAIGYVYQYGLSVNKTYPTRTFSVDGTGDIDTVPDLAMFTVSVVTEGGRNVADVQQANTDKMNRINAFLKGQGVEAKDLKTGRYDLSPRYSYPPCEGGVCPQPSINGYSLMQTLDVKVRDSEKLGDLLSGVVQNGANSVSSVRFVVDDDSAAKDEARAEAIAEAKKKAKDMARAGGFRLGKLVSIYENAGPVPTDAVYGRGGAEMGALKADVPPVVEPGMQTTQVQVNLTYEILD